MHLSLYSHTPLAYATDTVSNQKHDDDDNVKMDSDVAVQFSDHIEQIQAQVIRKPLHRKLMKMQN